MVESRGKWKFRTGMLKRTLNYNANTDNSDLLYEGITSTLQYRSLLNGSINSVCNQVNTLKSYIYTENRQEQMLYDTNGYRVKALLTKCASDLDDDYGLLHNTPHDCSWLITKFIDFCDDLDNKQSTIGLISTLKNIASDLENPRKIIKGTYDADKITQDYKLKYCIVNGVAYENIDPIFQKYLEQDVSDWIIYVINNPTCMGGLQNRYDLIFNILGIEASNLNIIEKKSIFTESPVYFEKHIVGCEYNISNTTKSKDFYALTPLITKFNKQINGYDTLIENVNKYKELDADNYTNSKPFNEQNYISREKIKNCCDDFIIEMCNGIPLIENTGYFDIVDICARFDIDLAVFKKFYFWYQCGLVNSIYLGILNRLLYGIVFDYEKIINKLPNVALYNYFILGEHKGALEYMKNPKKKALKLIDKHQNIALNDGIERDMNVLYHTIGTNDIKLLEMNMP